MKDFVEKNYENMLQDLKDLVKHNSVYAEDEKPFGKENRAVLEEAIRIMKDKGFETGNVDYYACYGEIGQGEQTIGIVAHLDIVPAGEGWDSDPFEVVQKGDRLYGRGVSDDKGAAVASMYAMKYLLDNGYPFKKKVRLILGCNEETGSKCMQHYVEKCGHVDLGFTPDGSFPGIYAEKGMISGLLKGRNTKIIDIKGGEARNIVCKEVECTVPNGSFDEDRFKKFLMDNRITFEIEKDENTKLTVHGVAAHGASPDLGVNAINYLFEALYEADFNDSYVNFFHKYIGLCLHGEKMDFESIKDEATDTSTNIGIVYKEGNEINATVDMRFAIEASVAKAKALLDVVKDDENEFVFLGGIEPLFFKQDSPMIQAMIKAYQDVTGDTESKMKAIGGGTYAKSIHNIIAFGCGFEKDKDNIHNANESMAIDNFKKQVLIYIEAIKNLNEV
ncbi:MAG: Sapep family Mn(2+)-dependent dipeptidase [Erysipelotrichaceae bacterium]|nr:Sapep family Mn(2+)-dependent dipeptidase [Erysipelotrichaceae bacterium]